MGKRIGVIGIVVALGVAGGGLGVSVVAAADGLFSEPTSTPRGRLPEAGSPALLRERPVVLEPAAIAAAERLPLNLFADVTVTAVRQRLERRGGEAFTWFGRVEGAPLSSAVFTVDGSRVVGNVILPGGRSLRILPTRGGGHAILELDASQLGGCAADGLETEPLPAPAAASPDSPARPDFAADDGSVVDLMVVYTPEAAAASANIGLEIQSAVDQTNQAYLNSGISMSLRLVHTAQVSTGDSGSSTTDLLRLQNPTDGFMDEVQGLRDAHCADLVALFTESGSACGVAFVMAQVSPTFEAYGYAVVRRLCATGGIVLGHELGHVMAARHDWYVDSTDFSPYTYNHGYVCSCNAWHDIMAYGDACSGCSAIPYFSNPDISYLGNPLGVPEGSFQAADVRKTINNTKLTVSNFRKSSVCRVLALDTPSRTLTDTPDGNGDGIADPGESVVMAVSLHDGESFGVTGLSAVLTTTTPGVTITDGSATWSPIAAGATAASQAPHFAFFLSSTVPCGTQIQFQLAVTAEEGTWSGTFPVTVGCNAWCNDVSFAGASTAADLDVCANSGVQVGWNPAVWGAAPLGYEVRRYADSGCSSGETVLATGLFATSFVDNTSPNGTDFWYRVFASNDCGRTSTGGACVGPAKDEVTTLTEYAWVSPNPVVAGTAQTFNAVVSGGTPPYSYLWDFTNDGVTDATTQNATYTYPAGAYYTFRFRVTDSRGCIRQQTGQVTVDTPPFATCAVDVSNQTGSDESPDVDGRMVAWESPSTGVIRNIFVWNGTSVQQLTNDGFQNRNAHVSKGRVAWERWDGSDTSTMEILYWDGQNILQLTNNAALDQNPIMDNGQVVWEAGVGGNRGIGYYDGTTVRIVDQHPFAFANTAFHNGQIAWTRVANGYRQIWFWNGQSVQQVTNTPGDKVGTCLHNGKLLWAGQVGSSGPYQIFYWDGTTTTQLTNTTGSNFTGGLGDGVAFWRGYDGNDWEIFRWDGATTTQLTNNSTDDGVYGNPYFNSDGDQAVWTWFDGNDLEIYFWNGTSVQALTNDITSEFSPRVRNGKVVWTQPVSGKSFEVMYWEADPTEVRNLRFTGGHDSISWDPIFCAASPTYSVIRGDVANLSASGGTVDLGAVVCEVPGTSATSATVPGAPASGCWFYVVKGSTATDYGKSSAREPENPSSGNCP